MMNFVNIKGKKGFTLPEIIAGALIITISAAGTYSVYIVARQFGERFKHRTMAWHGAAQISDELRYRYPYTGVALNIPSGSLSQHYNSKNAPTGLLDITKWGLSGEVNNLSAEYDVSYVWFLKNKKTNNAVERIADPNRDKDKDPTTGSPAAWKKIVVTIKWDERK